MPFSDNWDAAFEAAPADSENINLGAERIRDLKVAVRERMEIDHVWEDGQNDGRHNKLTMPPQSAAPTTSASYGSLYAATIGGVVELIFKNNNGALAQLTENGAMYPFATGDFSVADDLAVAGGATIGETLSVSTGAVSGFALFGDSGTGSRTVQFDSAGGGTYFVYVPSTGNVHLVIAGAVIQTWP